MRLKVPTFTYEVSGRKIFVFDDVVSTKDHVAMAQAIAGATYVRERSTLPGTEHAKYWSIDYPRKTIEALPLYWVILEYMEKYYPAHPVVLARAYVNNNSFGDQLSIHPDSPYQGSLTGIYYANATWRAEWGGETMFFNDDEEAVACVTPRPRRLVLFHGDLKHRGNPPLRNCYEARLVFAFKFEPTKAAQQVSKSKPARKNIHK